MKAKYFFIVFFLCVSSCFSQTGWIQQYTGTSNELFESFFLNENTGWVSGANGLILKTTNGGNNWTTNIVSSNNYLGIFFINQYTGWVVGANGYNANVILKTTNGGSSYELQTAPSNNALWDVRFLDNNTGFICGWNGTIYKTTNGGLQWRNIYSGTTNELYQIRFTNPETGWICGNWGRLLKTTDLGETWMLQSIGFTNYYFRSLDFADSQTGWIALETSGSVIKTTNGGINWMTQSVPVSSHLFSCDFYNQNTGWMCGYNGTIINTFNGGNQWVQQNTGTTTDLNNILFVNSTTGWAVGKNGLVLKTVTGGFPAPVAPNLISPPNNSVDVILTPTMNWSNVPGASNYKIRISTMPNFIVINDSATVDTTSYTVPNGKLSGSLTYFWRVNAANSAGTSPWSEVWSFSTITGPAPPVLLSPSNGIVGVSLTPLLDWENVGGSVSFKIQISTIPNFNVITDSATVINSQYTVPSGALQNLLTYFWRVNVTTSSGISPWSAVWRFTVLVTGLNQTGTEKPIEYKLYQNYPNPFNPSTKIKFDIPENTRVKMEIYDMSGRNVYVLINKDLSYGTYETTWNAKELPSGIYFIKLTTDKYSETKKIMLLK